MPNAILMLADDKRRFLDALLRHRSEYFGKLSLRDIRRLTRAPGPTAAWQLQGQLNARGIPKMPNGVTDVPINRTTDPGCGLKAPVRPIFEGSALVVEKGALQGLTATQLADYAAMRLLAKTSPERLAGSAAPAIVNILDAPMGSEVPPTLTRWISATSMASTQAGQSLRRAQRSAISRGITTELKQPEDENGQAEPARDKERPRGLNRMTSKFHDEAQPDRGAISRLRLPTGGRAKTA